MNRTRTARNLALAALAAGHLTAATATNGYFSHGYGMKAKGMGGASIALSQDAFAGANNPAAAAWAGNRVEGGVDLFSPRRAMERSGGGLNAKVESDRNAFLIPEFGYNVGIGSNLGLGVSVYGNGGMNTRYPSGQLNCGAGPSTANVLCGSGELGVDLMQLIVAPTIAYKVNPSHSIGVSPLFVYQQFKAYGLQAFDNLPGFPALTGAPGKVTNNGYDRSTGVGMRVGYLGKISDTLSIGASYSPKIRMGKFDSYAGLFAGAGGFDIPENYGIGVSFKARTNVTIALDYERINYSRVASVGNPSTNRAPLGADNGPGFGWSDINVWKVGAQWEATPQWTLRAGINQGGKPIQARDVSLNIMAPGVVTTHLTLGASYKLSDSSEVTLAYLNAQRKSVSGTSFFDALMGPGAGGRETIQMRQQSFGIQYGRRF